MAITTTVGMDSSTRTKVFNALRDGVITQKERQEIGLDNAFATQLQNDFANKKYVQIGDLAIFNKGRTTGSDGKTYQITRIEQCPTNEPQEQSALSKAWNAFLDFLTPSSSYYTSNAGALDKPDDANAITMKNAKIAWCRYVERENSFIESMSSR